MKLIGEGAEAKIYEANLFGTTVIIKNRHEKGYRVKALDIMLRKSRTKNEARILFRANKAGVAAPKIIAASAYTIVMSKVSGHLLKDIDAGLQVFYKAGLLLAKLHSNDIVHGDFTPANIVCSEHKKDVFVIDFGLGEITNSIEARALDLLLMKRSVSRNAYAAFENAYKKNYAKSKEVVGRLHEIEMRGRYQDRSLTTEKE